MAASDPANPLRFTFAIPADHPSLAGHFPGAPVVPGVIVLDYVLSQLAWPASAPHRLAWVKFISALLPEQVATATICQEIAGWRFTVARGKEVLVQGMLAPASADMRAES